MMHRFIEKYWLHVLMVATVITRLPFLSTGYGADIDAWLVARSASDLWNTGVYRESRLPGYPLHEFVSAPLIGLGGAPLSNGATLVATLFAIAVWSGIIRNAGIHKKLTVMAFAFAPVVWQNSAVTLDYLWSLLFILLSFDALYRQRFILGGVALGIAAGFRPSNIAAVIPLLCLMYLQKQDLRRVALFVSTAAVVVTVAFIPLLLRYGIPGWFIATGHEMSDVLHPQAAMRWIAFFYRTIYFMGPFAALAAGYALWKKKDGIAASVRSGDPVVVSSIVGVSTFWLLFLWLPMDRAYLLPAFPFFLLLVDRVSTRRVFAVFTLLLVLSSVISFDVIDATTRRTFRPNVHAGMVLEEFILRRASLSDREAMFRAWTQPQY
ncbi:MAG TPA: hypothetical protein VI758_02590 [Bacteroidota bacterium]